MQTFFYFQCRFYVQILVKTCESLIIMVSANFSTSSKMPYWNSISRLLCAAPCPKVASRVEENRSEIFMTQGSSLWDQFLSPSLQQALHTCHICSHSCTSRLAFHPTWSNINQESEILTFARHISVEEKCESIIIITAPRTRLLLCLKKKKILRVDYFRERGQLETFFVRSLESSKEESL